ncbi:MAG: NADPH:quinone oxidoreductase family protein [Pseudomonadota bacterium]
MRAALVTELGLETCTIGDVALEPLTAGHARVQVHVVGLNHADLLMLAGRYQNKPPLPFSPGAELAGVIVDPGTGDLPTGTRVMAYVGHGAARDMVDVPIERLVPVPDAVDFRTAAGLAVTYGTALHGLVERAGCTAGETVAITGAAGGAGLAAVEIARVLGAVTVAVAQNEEKLKIARDAGAVYGLLAQGSQLKDDLKAVGGTGIAIVYDCVGGDLYVPCMRALPPGGRYLHIGFAGGQVPDAQLNVVMIKAISLIGVNWGAAVAADVAGHRADMARLLAWCASGALSPRTGAVVPLGEINDALDLLRTRRATGKVVVDIT